MKHGPIDDRCETISGNYRCMHNRGHAGACEAQAREYVKRRADIPIIAWPKVEPATDPKVLK